MRAGSLMPVKQMPSMEDLQALLRRRVDDAYSVMRDNLNRSLYGDLTEITRKAFLPRLHVQVYEWSSIEHATRTEMFNE